MPITLKTKNLRKKLMMRRTTKRGGDKTEITYMRKLSNSVIGISIRISRKSFVLKGTRCTIRRYLLIPFQMAICQNINPIWLWTKSETFRYLIIRKNIFTKKKLQKKKEITSYLYVLKSILGNQNFFVWITTYTFDKLICRYGFKRDGKQKVWMNVSDPLNCNRIKFINDFV